MKSLKLLSAAILASTALVGTTSVFAADAAVEPVAGLVKQGSMKALPVAAAPVEAAPAAGAAGGAAVGGAGLAQPAAEADAEVATTDAARDRYFAKGNSMYGKLMRAESAEHLLSKTGGQSVKDALTARKAAVADKIGADITALGARPADIKLEPVVVTQEDVLAALGDMTGKAAPFISLNKSGEVEYITKVGKVLEDTEMVPSTHKGKISSFTVADIKKALDTAKSGKKPANQAAHDEAVAKQALYDENHSELEAARAAAAGIDVEKEFAALTDKKPVAHKVLAELAKDNGFAINVKAVDAQPALVEFFASLTGKQEILEFLRNSVKAQISEAVTAAKPTINEAWVEENFDALEEAGLTYASNMDVLKKKIVELSAKAAASVAASPASSRSVSRASSVARTATGASLDDSLSANPAPAAAAAAAAAAGGDGTGLSSSGSGVPVTSSSVSYGHGADSTPSEGSERMYWNGDVGEDMPQVYEAGKWVWKS